MDETFDVLEQKVHKAAELVNRLKARNRSLEEDLTKARAGLEEADRRLRSLEKKHGSSTEQARQLEALTEEVKGLRGEREEIRRRIAKVVEVLEGLE
jgi:chromosome segregation ATPase